MLIHELPDSDKVYAQTHIRITIIRHTPDKGILIRGRLGTVDAEGGFNQAKGVNRVQLLIHGSDRTDLEEATPAANTAPTKVRDPMQRYENGVLRYLDSAGWRNFWNL